MRRLLIATGAAALLVIAVVATVAAAGPMGRAGGAGATERAGTQADVAADILGLTRDAINDLRHDGLSLAQIAEKQKVDPQKLVDALTMQWTARIDARVENGALTAGGRVVIAARDVPGGRIRIEVRDSGPGIAAGDLPHVFDRLYQADPARDRRAGSSGLGLAIVRALVEAQGGRVGAGSAPEGGALVWLELPGV